MLVFLARKLRGSNAKAIQTYTPLSNFNETMSFELKRSLSSINSNQEEEEEGCNTFTVSYLISSCGLSKESAKSVSKAVRLKDPERPDSVVKFFRNCGFLDTHIASIIKKQPSLLLADPENTLKPKFEFFTSVGAVQSIVEKIVLACPGLLLLNLDKKIIPTFEFLKSLQHTNDNVVASIKKHPWLLKFNPTNTVTPNVAVLRDEGVPESAILHFLKSQLSVLMQNPVRFKEIVDEVKKMGFDPLKCTFRTAICVLKSINRQTWERKSNLFRGWGWSDNEILSAFQRQPAFMMVSEESIEKKMNFLVNTIGLDTSFIAGCPNVLLLSLEKRIIPRCTVIQTLLSKGLIGDNVKFSTALATTDCYFINKYVTKHEGKVPELLNLYPKNQII